MRIQKTAAMALATVTIGAVLLTGGPASLAHADEAAPFDAAAGMEATGDETPAPDPIANPASYGEDSGSGAARYCDEDGYCEWATSDVDLPAGGRCNDYQCTWTHGPWPSPTAGFWRGQFGYCWTLNFTNGKVYGPVGPLAAKVAMELPSSHISKMTVVPKNKCYATL